MGSRNSKAPKPNKAFKNTQAAPCSSNLFQGQQLFQIVGVLAAPPPQPAPVSYCPQPMAYAPPPPPPPQHCYSYPPPPQTRYC